MVEKPVMSGVDKSLNNYVGSDTSFTGNFRLLPIFRSELTSQVR